MSGKVNGGLSIVLLTRNEEDKIGRCLESIKGWADEIIVVDDRSTDNTLRICEEYKCKIVPHPLNSDFSTQRN